MEESQTTSVLLRPGQSASVCEQVVSTNHTLGSRYPEIGSARKRAVVPQWTTEV